MKQHFRLTDGFVCWCHFCNEFEDCTGYYVASVNPLVHQLICAAFTVFSQFFSVKDKLGRPRGQKQGSLCQGTDSLICERDHAV